MAEIIKQTGNTQVFFALHPDREPAYAEEYPVPQIEDFTIVRDVLNRYKLPCVDLNDVFSLSYRESKRKFEFETNMHWNVYGNTVAMQGIREQLCGTTPSLDSTRTTAVIQPSSPSEF